MTGGTRSYEMARRLVAMGHEVSMVTSWRGQGLGVDWFETNEAGVQVHWLPVPYSNEMGYSERLRSFAKFAFGAANRAANIPCDIVFATSTPLTIALPGVFASKRLKVPMVFEVRDLWPELPIAMGALSNPVMRMGARWLERFAYRNACQIIALSPGMQSGIASAGYPVDRIHVIPNSADLELFSSGNGCPTVPYDLPPGPMVLYAGTLGRINGVEYMAHVASEALKCSPDIQFVIIGEGHQQEIIKNVGLELGVLGKNFHIYPPVPKHEMPGILAAADVAMSLFVDLPEMWANSANKFFDALASGTPVAINYGGWQADLLNETGAGIVLPAKDAKGAAFALEELIRDKRRLIRAGVAAFDLARARFDRDVLAKKLESVLVRAVNL